MKPNVVVHGFGRCGTSYLWDILKQHPNIFIPKVKEINYFNNTWYATMRTKNPKRKFGDDWYLSFFDTDKKVVMDFSVWDAYDLDSAQRVKKLLGEVKAIFIIRNKEDHANSVYRFRLSKPTIPNISFKEYKKVYDYKSESDFKTMMKPYKQRFKKVLVISLEEIKKDKKNTLKKVTDFLELKPYNFNYVGDKNEIKLKNYSKIKRFKNLILFFVSKIGLLYYWHKFLSWGLIKETHALYNMNKYKE